jgi:hypothetical protein
LTAIRSIETIPRTNDTQAKNRFRARATRVARLQDEQANQTGGPAGTPPRVRLARRSKRTMKSKSNTVGGICGAGRLSESSR